MARPTLGAVLLRVVRPGGREVPPAKDVPLRLLGEPGRVSGLATVAPGTSVLLFPPGGRVALLPAGSVVGPALVPATAPAYVVLTHHAVSLDLVLGPFASVDSRVLETVVLRMTVQLADPPRGLVDLAQQVGPDLERTLLDRLRSEVTEQVRVAVSMNRLVDLERQSVSGVLQDGWLAASFLGGLLVRHDLQVTDVGWPTQVALLPQGYLPRRAR